MVSLQGRRRATGCLLLLCLLCRVVLSQDAGDASSGNDSTGSSDTTSAPPRVTTPSTTTTASPTTTVPATKTPTPTTSAPSPSSTETPATGTPTPTTKSPLSTTTSAPSSTTSDASSPSSTTAAPVVKHYNSSTLPPGLSSSVLNGSDLVNVEVTETTEGNGSTSYSYVIVTDAGETEKVVVVNPTATASSTGSGSTENNTLLQPGSFSSGGSNTSKSSGTLGFGAIIGIIGGVLVLLLALVVFIVAQRRRNKNRSNGESSNAMFDLPAVGKQERLLDQGQLLAATEHEDATRTTADSQSFGDSMRYRSTMWEHPIILASRIPIDHVEFGDVISRGAYGVVYRGHYRDREVAIKTLVPEKRKDMDHIEAFLSEVRLMATLEHPNIVLFIGVAWESLGDLCCVAEFMTGGDLRTLLKDYLANDVPQGMDTSKMQIAYDVAYALTYLHSLQPVVLHRDLKSRNILLTESLNAKITDFGASRIRSDGTMTSNVGSSLWMAPEIMMGGRYNEKADVFSLGVVISELDTHELPYSHVKESNNRNGRPLPGAAVLQMVSMGKLRVRFSESMHPGVGHFVERCLSVNPDERPSAAEVLYYLQVAIRGHQY